MNLKSILHLLLYKDKVTVYRLQRVRAEDGSDDYEEMESPVALDIPCKLSQYGKDIVLSKTDRAVDVTENLRLCTDPDVDIREGDRVDIKHEGVRLTLFAGARFPYPTHQEISVWRKREAAHGA